MQKIRYGSLEKEAQDYWEWHVAHPILPMDSQVAREGAGSELRSPLFHLGTVLPVYLGVIRYLRTLPSTKGLKLVELGSGTGRVLSYLQSLFPYMEIWGTDYSADCTAYAKLAYGQYGIHFVHARAQGTTLRSGSMDIVISSHVIEHISGIDGPAFLTESRRLLKKGGIAFVGTPERRKSQDIYMKNPQDEPSYRLVPPHEHEYRQEELGEKAAAIFGAKQVKVDKIYNPVFRNIFFTSIAKFKPTTEILGTLRNYLYRSIRDYLPKLWFDHLTRLGARFTMKRLHLSYRDILMANTLASPTERPVADNLLLVAQK